MDDVGHNCPGSIYPLDEGFGMLSTIGVHRNYHRVHHFRSLRLCLWTPMSATFTFSVLKPVIKFSLVLYSEGNIKQNSFK